MSYSPENTVSGFGKKKLQVLVEEESEEESEEVHFLSILSLRNVIKFLKNYSK